MSFEAGIANEEATMDIATFDIEETPLDQEVELIDVAQLEIANMELLAMAADPSLEFLPSFNVEPLIEAPEQSLGDDLKPDSGISSVGRSLKTSRPNRKRSVSSVSWMQTISKNGTNVREPLLVDPKDGTRQTRSPSEAAETIMGKLTASVNQDGQVWILWLMDASLSLVEEREALAPQIFSFYQGIKLSSASRAKPKPKTAVFAFGQMIVPVQADLGSISPGEIALFWFNVKWSEG